MDPVVVIGMHRSGTSLLVKVLEKLGVFMGEDQEHNRESLFFIWINKWILRQAQTSWDNPENYEYFSEEAKEAMIPIIKNRLTSLHKKEYFGKLKNQSSFSEISFPWGWKDPRNTITIDIWEKIFGQLKIIHIYRNPIDVINSLYKREKGIITEFGSPERKGIKHRLLDSNYSKDKLFLQSFRCLNYTGGYTLWEEYVTRAFSFSKDSSSIMHIAFEELISSPENIFADIIKFLDLEPKGFSTKNIINSERRFAFLNNPELVDFYMRIKDDELMKKLNYNRIVKD